MKFELFNAILAMDVYHRGYDRGINLPTVLNTTKVGYATISVQSDTDPNSNSVSEGFYALAYDIESAGKIIAYRGTDYPVGGDAGKISDLDDWLQGGGTPGGQSAMAIDFYNAVARESIDPRVSNISLTGHSLGGGLAGLVGALYGKDGILFDNMAFEIASDYVKTVAENSSAIRNSVYNGQTPWNKNLSGLHTYSIAGEILSPNRLLQKSPETVLDLGNDVQFGNYSYWNTRTNISELAGAAIARHSMSSLVIRMFADEDHQIVNRDWENSAKYFWSVLYDAKFAASLGFKDFNIHGQYQSNEQYADIMRTMIAYSAIDEGTRVFGDTGIKALFDDAGDFGRMLKHSPEFALSKKYVEEITKAYVQFAGQLALAKILEEDAQTLHRVY